MTHEFGLISIIIPLVVSLVIILKSCFLMIEKKNIFLFLPFFMLGIVILTSAAFSYYHTFEEAAFSHRTFRVMAYGLIFYILWRME